MPRRSLAAALVAAAWAAGAAAAEPGEPVEPVQLPALAGGLAPSVVRGQVNVLVFVKPEHPHCEETLRDLAGRQAALAKVRWVAILPGDTAPDAGKALAAACGVKLPLLLDPGDALYGRLGLKLHPTVLVVDRDGRLAAVEPFREINYWDRLVARIRFTLGEIGEAELRAAEEPARSDTRTDGGVARRHAQFAQKLLDMGQADAALAEAQKSLAVVPTAPGYLVQGRALAQQGKCKEAARAYEMALGLDPGNAAAAAERSRCPAEKGRAP